MEADKIIVFINGNGFCDTSHAGFRVMISILVFRAGHSTDTALLPVFNYILAADSGQSSLLLLLYLKVAFVTVDNLSLNESCAFCVSISALFKIGFIPFSKCTSSLTP